MLAISPLRSNKDGNDKESAMEANFSIGPEDFPNFTGANLLDNIDFNDLFMGMHDGDILPDLEMDPELLAEFSISSNTRGGEESSDANNSSSAMSSIDIKNVISPNRDDGNIEGLDACETNKDIDDDGDFISQVILNKNEEIKGEKTPVEVIESKKDVKVESTTSTCSLSCKEAGEKRKRLSSNSKNNNSNNDNNNNQAKRKTKVDWTPELHRRFVQVVEQLGVDKAVPSRILELMGIDCLTRHNIASHLQKYRSHRKHLLAREVEAASWTQKRQMYSVAMVGGKGGANGSPWYPPTMGFLPMATMHPPFRPLHVWGHPTMDPQSRMPMWPKQVVPSTSTLPPAWAPHPPVYPSFWNSFHYHRVGVTAGSGISPHTSMLRPNQHGLLSQQPPQSSGSNRPLELHPSKESIDAAIGDILAKPWQPLPIGLKPPSTDSVMVELQRHGIPKIPPSCA